MRLLRVSAAYRAAWGGRVPIGVAFFGGDGTELGRMRFPGAVAG
jgi:hypothetical protein